MTLPRPLELEVKIQSAADFGEVNVVSASLQKMSFAAVDETSSEEVQPSYHCQSNQSVISLDIRLASQLEKSSPSAGQSQHRSNSNNTINRGDSSSEDPVCS